MHITKCEAMTADELLARLRATKLRGFGQPDVYKAADISIVAKVPTEDLWPAQKYLLRSHVDRITKLRATLLAQGYQDIFALQGGLTVWSDSLGDRGMPVIPPVVEESLEADGKTYRLINDGLHRVSAARRLGLPISIVLVRGIPKQWPYYAFPLENHWADVQEMDEIPPRDAKRKYRLEGDSYKDLYREFDKVFPGVQEKRSSLGDV